MMPPRTPSTLLSGVFNLTALVQALPTSISRHPESFTKCSACLFSTSSALQMKRRGKKRKNERKDPYRLAQALQRKTANLAKRALLQTERAAALGDPIRSKPTAFLQSLYRASDSEVATDSTGQRYLNYYLTPDMKEEQVKHSQWLSEPLGRRDGPNSPAEEEELRKRRELHEQQHENATHAIDNIVALDNSSSKDRTRINIKRCIEEFGRHNTDSLLPPKPASLGQSRTTTRLEEGLTLSPEEERRVELMAELAAVPKRAGPDTGSSEVQVAILTAKINILANDLYKKDKHNKRNLRLLVHKRAKLLKYLRRKERGGPRWQNLVDSLGINEAMWKGEISL